MELLPLVVHHVEENRTGLSSLVVFQGTIRIPPRAPFRDSSRDMSGGDAEDGHQADISDLFFLKWRRIRARGGRCDLSHHNQLAYHNVSQLKVPIMDTAWHLLSTLCGSRLLAGCANVLRGLAKTDCASV